MNGNCHLRASWQSALIVSLCQTCPCAGYHTRRCRQRKAKPYLLGQQQRPSCVNCRKNELWAHFCQFKSHGPVCPQWDQDHLLETLMGRYASSAAQSLACLVHAQHQVAH